MVLAGDAVVTFRRFRPATSDYESITGVVVYLYRAARDVRLYPYTAAYDWAVVYDVGLAYGDGTPIAAGDQIVTTVVEGGVATLERPRPTLGFLPCYTAYFKEHP